MGIVTHETVGTFSTAQVAYSFHKNAMAKMTDHMLTSNETQITASIVLEPEVMNSLYRRGRRRLKDIQATCQVTAQLDKLHGLLRLSGPESGVNTAKRLIAGLGGPRVAVKTAVWTELLRTRTLQEGTQAIVVQIQNESGCRIHIERSRHEVRLFGDAQAVAIAERLLQQLDQDCGEAMVPLKADSSIAPALQSLAHSCGVTLRLDENHVAVFGMKEAVSKAVKELDRCLTDPQALAMFQPVQQIAEEPAEAQVRLNTPSNTESDCDADSNAAPRTACPTCGACPFCTSCGAPTTFLPRGSLGNASTVSTAVPDSPATVVSQAPMSQTPWIGQQLPVMDWGGGMVQISAMVPQEMVQQGMVPAVCMIPESMMGQDSMGQQHPMMTQDGMGQQFVAFPLPSAQYS
jgi:hypothetical protein